MQVQLQWKEATAQQKLKAMDSRAKTWLLYFKIYGFTSQMDLDQPLPLEQLQINPDHPITQRLLSLYSMETLIPSIIRNATMNMDRSKI